MVVIISDRKNGIIPTIASVLATSSQPVDVVLIGLAHINQQVQSHFGSRIRLFTTLTVADVTQDLQQNAGLEPIWTWPEWQTSIRNPHWRNANTLHVGSWDHLLTHAHELNHVRFYLPYLSIFQDYDSFFFMDDDVLVRTDLSVLATKAIDELGSDSGLIAPCNVWTWNSTCSAFEFQSQRDSILEMPSLYGNRGVCQTESETQCVPANYWKFVHNLLPEHGDEQRAWNFGFSLFALEQWKALDLTSRYEKVMKESYRLHVFPETSLTFGLGVAFIAFAGAVQCWNEDHVKVRDGFGFIELDRFVQTFGTDFLEKSVDVMHFTGPDKPWVSESRIDPWAVTPWLEMMTHEKLPLPAQLPAKASDNLVTIYASEFTGIDFIMAELDMHHEVCASGEHDRPETGFPTDSLDPSGLDWLTSCSVKKGCTFGFVNQSVVELLSTMTDDDVSPRRCSDHYNPSDNNDILEMHLPRLCSFVRQLDNRYDSTRLLQLWIDAYAAEDKSLLGCKCPRGVKVKGLKVLPEWTTYYWDEAISYSKLNLNQTKLHGSKIIRIQRQNLWSRYKAMMTAIQTQIFNPSTPAEKKTQLEALSKSGNLTLDIFHLDWHILYMQALDRAADAWAADHGSNVLSLVYEDCMKNSTSCVEQVYNFVGVSAVHNSKTKKELYTAMFAGYDEIEASMEYVANAFEIEEKMGLHGWDRFISKRVHRPIQLLLYNDDDMLINTRHYPGINVTVFGSDRYNVAFGSKYANAIAILAQMSPETVVVLGDLSTTWVNFPLGGINVTIPALANFRASFDEVSKRYDGAVVVSAERICCSSALSHLSPGQLFDRSNKRAKRTCSPGDSHCEWKANNNAQEWQQFMTKLAKQRSTTSTGRSFLDAGLMAGEAVDLKRLLEDADVFDDEDDQAVFTDFMFRNPDRIVLDYDRKLLGEPAMDTVRSKSDLCLVDASSEVSSTDASPRALFLRMPRHLECTGKSTLEESTLSPSFPAWGTEGIMFNPIADHIERVMAKEEMIVVRQDYRHSGAELDYPQGPELLYIFDKTGLWTSRLIRDRTDNTTFFARLVPTENMTMRAHAMLMQEEMDTPRWPALKQAVHSTTTGGIPYWSWYGDYKICNWRNHGTDSIPVFTTCARSDCKYAFPMPTYMTEIDSQNSNDNWLGFFRENSLLYPRDSKVRKVVWRGALSEADGDKIFTSVRWRLAKYVHEHPSDDMFDVGLTSIPSWVMGNKKDFDLTEVGGLVAGFSPMTEFQRYVAILDMDGNSWSSRFGTLLCYNSVVIKVEPQYVEFFYSELRPWVHYIPVRDDFADLEENVAWALNVANDAQVQRIIGAANQWCSKRLVPDELARDVLDILEAYVHRLNQGDPTWQTRWQRKREEISSSLSAFDPIRLER